MYSVHRLSVFINKKDIDSYFSTFVLFLLMIIIIISIIMHYAQPPKYKAAAPFMRSRYHRVTLAACNGIHFWLFVAPLMCLPCVMDA